MLGKFPQGHALAGQQRLVVLKVNENYSSQIPSCWSTGHVGNPLNENEIPHHPPIPAGIPDIADRLQEFEHGFAIKQCPHCQTVWNRDVNACRYPILS